MSNPHDYTVGWICAISTEYVAAQAFLDEKHEGPDHVATHDNNDYTLGRIGKHNVVIAVLPHGEYGLSSAASVGRDMLHSFPNVRIGLMVGIAGGAPSPKHDIRLGDVVVSASGSGKGGVLQYDFGKSIQGKKFQQTGFLNQPPPILRAAVHGLMAQYESDGHELAQAIGKAIKRKPRLQKKYRRPETNTDRLYLPSVLHPQDNDAVCADCCSDDPSLLQSRLSRTEDDDHPAIHYGLIGSANQLIKDATIRDAIAAEKDVLCFEMESAGLINHFPCLVIRGICDYSDSHKNKEWQGYAAMTASAYAKDVLYRIAPNKVEAEKKIGEVLSRKIEMLNEVIERMFHQREDHHREKVAMTLSKEQQECHQAFKTSTYEQYKNINPDPVEGTCRWIFENSQYLSWQNSDHNDLLWISADPGCGKSVLAKSLVDKGLKVSTSASVCYFFFKDNDEQNTLTTAICAVLHQLFGMNPHLLRHALPSWQRNGTKVQQEVDELWRILEAAILDDAFSNTVCLFDALDECRPRDRAQLIEKLASFYTQSHSSSRQGWLKFLVTSRPHDDIQEGFRPATQLFPSVHVRGEEENYRIHEEINLVVKMQVAKLGESLQLSHEAQKRLELQLLQMEHRTYLWLHLAVDDIRTMLRNSLQPSEESIQLIPNSVSAAYTKILNRVPPSKVPDVRMILQIIVGARRPLTIKEMAMALGVARSPGLRTAAKAGLNPEGLDRKIRQLCGLFVFVNNSTVYLIHQTAREFLLSDGQKWFLKQSDTETLLSEICINYLLLDDMNGSIYRSDEGVQNFLEYSAEHWPDHVREMPVLAESKAQTRIDKLYDVTSTRFPLWYPMFWNAVRLRTKRPKMNAFRLAAFNGHKGVLRRLILSNRNMMNEVDEDGTNALHWASERGHLEVVQMLLREGADVNAQGGQYGNALQAASFRGHVDIVQTLLHEGADVTAQGGLYSNALQAASGGGHVDVVQVLLYRGAEIDTRDKNGRTPLSLAAEMGHEDVVRLLLQDIHRVDVNSLSSGSYNGGRSPLSYAAEHGHHSVVNLLLSHGSVALDLEDGSGRTPLMYAVAGAKSRTAQTLIERSASVTVTDYERKGMLHHAILNADSEPHVVKLLIAQGAPTQSADADNMTPLHYTVRFCRADIAELLLRAGVSVDIIVHRRTWIPKLGRKFRPNPKQPPLLYRTKRGLTPLHYASWVGQEKMVSFFLQNQANPNSLSEYGETPLHLALGKILRGPKFADYRDYWTDSDWKAEAIMDHIGIDENDEFESAQEAILNHRMEVVSALLNDARTNAKITDFKAESALHKVRYGEYGSEKLAQRLLQGDVVAASRCCDNKTPLHLACEARDIRLISIFASSTSLSNCDSSGQNALHLASKSGCIHTMAKVIEECKIHGVDLSLSRDKRQRNALHCYTTSLYLREKGIQLLLDYGVDCGEADIDGNLPLFHYPDSSIPGIKRDIVRLMLPNGFTECIPTTVPRRRSSGTMRERSHFRT